jgi:beta-glucanase (GH16 family)
MKIFRPIYSFRSLFFLAGSLLFHIQCSKKSPGAGTVINNPPPPPPPLVKPYQLVWSDEFNTDGLPDSTKWGYDTGGNGWGNNELEYYTSARPENAVVKNGNLVIQTIKENYAGSSYTSARLLTKGKVQWSGGKFEIRAKIPKGIGTWPAIWLLSATNPLVWPDDGELDIMEEVGFNPDVIYGTAHNKMYNGAQGTQKGGNITIADAQDSFHVYTLEWTNSQIDWSVDSTKYFTYSDPGYGYNAWPYTHDFFIILNIAIGGNWGGQKGVDDSIFPQQMLVDYVRVYQRK